MTDQSGHLDELLSGYIDGELTQQQRQRVDNHCDACEACRAQLQELRLLRQRIGAAELSELGEDVWRENMRDLTVTATKGFGWLLFLVGVLAVGAVVVYEFVTDPSLPIAIKLASAALYGGLALLFVSVLRQRLIERKTDKYKDVEV